MDCIRFDGHDAKLLNIWGQEDLSAIHNHYFSSLQNVRERFSVQFNLAYCAGALSDAPEEKLWGAYQFFAQMEKAVKSRFYIDDALIKNVGATIKHGALLELRCYGPGWRIFFARKNGSGEELLLGGFYRKTGSKREQNIEIGKALNRINKYK